MNNSKLYKVTNFILKIKSYLLTGSAFITIIFSGILICNGNKIIEETNKNPSTNKGEAIANCSTALVGGIAKALGIIFLICAIIALVIGIVYLMVSRSMKRQEGISNRPVITFFVFELVSAVIVLIVTFMFVFSDAELFAVIITSIGLIQCIITSILLGKLLSYKIVNQNV